MKSIFKTNHYTVLLVIGLMLFASTVYGQTKPISQVTDTQKSDEHFETAVRLYDKKNYNGAIRELTTAIKLNPKNLKAYLIRGNAYSEKRDYDTAIKDFSKMIALIPQEKMFSLMADGNPYIYRGRTYLAKKDFDSAIKDFTKAIEFNPQESEFYGIRGEAFQKKKDCNSAIRDYTKAIEISPKNALSYENRAECYEAIGKKDLAEADRKKVNELENPNADDSADEPEVVEKSEAEAQMEAEAEKYVRSGNENFVNKNLKAAIEDYTKAIKIYPQGFVAYKYRANAYELLGKKVLSQTDRQKAKKLEVLIPDLISTVPRNDKKEQARQYITFGNKYFVEKQFDKAIEFYTEAIESDPQNSRAYKNRANTYEAMGKKDLAEADRKKYEELSKSN